VPGGVLGGRTAVESPTEGIELHSNMSKFRTNEERAHNGVVPTVSPVVVGTANSVKVPGLWPTEGCRAEQTTCGTNAYPYKADFDSWWRGGRSVRRWRPVLRDLPLGDN
jgi:hypothetical protein